MGSPVGGGLGHLAAGAPVTLVDGASFCISGACGDIAVDVEGLIVAGYRLLSRCVMTVNGRRLAPVDSHVDDPSAGTFVCRAHASGADGGTADGPIVIRRRFLGEGMRDDVEIRNPGDEAAYVEVAIELAADLARADELRDGGFDGEAVEPELERPGGSGGGTSRRTELVLARGHGAARLGCRIGAVEGVTVRPGRLDWEAIVPARGTRSFSVVITPIVAGAELAPRYPLGAPVERSESGWRLDRWQRGAPEVTSDHHGLLATLRRSAHDLGSLRVLDPDFPERAVVAAGAPWFLALHGRDAIFAAYMSLILDPELALGTVETLARFQGRDVDERTEEQPGRIAHRLGFGSMGFGQGPGAISYGSVDATPLFVMLLGELRRWGLAPEVVDRLLPHADRALEWITSFGDRDGDGYVEYQRSTDRGVRHQTWKDSTDPIRLPDGRPARGPLALAEVQGYAYAAFRARSHFAAEAGDAAGATRWREVAAELQGGFNRDFWVEDAGWVALALDGEKRQVGSLASNIGHCLWTGILYEDKAAILAKQLVSDDLFSGWGLRTLAASMGGFDPIGPHTGAVWPHDNAACVAGLVRYGFVDEAHRLLMAQLEAAEADGGRLGVLCGFDRNDLRAPVRYPDPCTTRAWSAAAPLSFLRSLLRLDPWIPQGKLWLDPVLPAAIRRLRVERIPLLGGRVTVTVEGDRVEVEDLPPGIELISAPRRPLTGGS
ncbi:MAG TPA: glycogen debranching N-terminal domain-containing protein [Acidimicrobiales bacterium]|nr:glycogen debranching N-terminal domain-containing protein [Acidimicrobiales bacterium]